MFLAKVQRYAQRHGKFSLLRLPFFPLMLLITNPIRLAKTLWSAREIGNGKWSEYLNFRPLYGINSLFYWTIALNFDRYGRSGTSPYVGTGDYHLGQWWHMSLTSTYLYWRLGAMLPIMSMFGWLAMHIFWLEQPHVCGEWLALVLGLALISSYFYASAFVFLNYNAFGWLFMPLGLFGIITGNYWIASLAWFAASLGSMTAVFIAGCLSLAWAIVTFSILPLVALLPACIKLISHFLYLQNIKESLKQIANGIGIFNGKNSGVKYTRNNWWRQVFALDSLYVLVTWISFLITVFFNGGGAIQILIMAGIALWVVNQSLARFADQRSLYLMMFALATTATILTPSIWVLVAYWLVVSPLPFIISGATVTKNPDHPTAYKPFNVSTVVTQCKELLSVVPKGSRILLSLDDPKGEYSKIFDGYRVNYEAIFYAANLKRILVFPDWWAVFENNTVDSEGFWGKEPSDVMVNADHWKADYVLIHQDSGSKLEAKWTSKGFSCLADFDWAVFFNDVLSDEVVWLDSKSTPKWFLLKLPV